ncbi:MAG: AAA family ATPase, partial [Actinomycetospora chiangmaiensis]|nr:AAA family ATPase [Actinomycetospora chiangmaiensis]
EDDKTYGAGDLVPPGVPTLVVLDAGSVRAAKGKHDHDPAKDAAPILGKRLPLVMPPHDLGAARAELLDEFPHLARIVDRLLRPLAQQETVRLPHVLLWGPPGCAKTRFARRFAEVLDLSPSMHPLGGATDSLVLSGTARGWSTAGFCAPVWALIKSRIANPVLVMDEVDKIGTGRQNGSAVDVLVNMMGAETSARYRDPYLEAPVDISRVQWILTANELDRIPRPLLDRCLVFRVDEPGPEQLRTLATSILADVRADRGLDEIWAPPFDGVEWAALEEHWPGGSLRALRRLVETVLDARDGGLRQ